MCHTLKNLFARTREQSKYSDLLLTLEMYRQLVQCLYGRERMTKAFLEETRGFGVAAECYEKDGQGLTLRAMLETKYLTLVRYGAFLQRFDSRVLFSAHLSMLLLEELLQRKREEIDCRPLCAELSRPVMLAVESLFDSNEEVPSAKAITFIELFDVLLRRHRNSLQKRLLLNSMKELLSAGAEYLMLVLGELPKRRLTVSIAGTHWVYDPTIATNWAARLVSVLEK